jgi:Ca2+-binding EF-hand superfamily protein
MMEPEMCLWLVRLLGVSAICLGALAVPAHASPEWIITRMGNVVRADVTWDQVRSQMLPAFYQSNPDERGVSPQGIDNLRRITAARQRSQVITQILNYDLDGDGNVTKDEIIAAMQPRARQLIPANGVQLEPTPQQVRLQLDRLVSDALKPDTDGDGVITAAEIQQEAQKHVDQASLGWQQSATQFVPMTLDADGDGAVSLAEYEAALRQQFDAIDQDRDGRVSADEFVNFTKRLNEARQAEQRAREARARKARFEAAVAGCDVPAAPAGARLILLGAGQGKALSNAWIGTEDRVTSVTTLEIAPGREPLYLALTSGGAMIWDIVGATERIAGIVAHAETAADKAGDGRAQQRVAAVNAAGPQRSGKPLVGVIGVPRETIRFTAHTGCLVPASEATMKDGSAQEMAALLLGRAADEIGGEHNAATFRVPAARHYPDRPVRNAMPLPKEGLGEALWREVQEDYPAGIAQIEVESVISAHPVQRYTVLPGRAGLAALVDAGALTIAGTSRGIRINGGDFKPFTSPNKFRITEKIRLPAGAAGTFILPRDMPVPEGDVSQACVLSETDTKPVSGSRAGCS